MEEEGGVLNVENVRNVRRVSDNDDDEDVARGTRAGELSLITRRGKKRVNVAARRQMKASPEGDASRGNDAAPE